MLKQCLTLLAPLFVFAAMGAATPADAGQSKGREGMALIPAGEYLMGDKKSNRGFDPTAFLNPDRHALGPENPSHTIYVDSFFIDIYEVTNADYEKYRQASDVGNVAKSRFWDNLDYNNPRQPVVGINWKEARRYCFWNNKRLPREAEWEKAGRGKRSIKYAWGDEEPDSTKLNYNDEMGKPALVGSHEAGKSDYGVYDLSGNVAEWVFDWHDAEFYMFSPKKNPKGPSKGKYKIIRGGSWRNSLNNDVSLTYRGATVPKVRSETVGFRCVADAEKKENN